jgi:predicted TIM-barrel fold metal-dependent hydrolase
VNLLTDEERARLDPAELAAADTPIPVQIVSSDEFVPIAQTPKQREVEARLTALADQLARKQGLTRRQFFRSAAGMAAAYLAMNDVYGPLFEVSRAEAATPELAGERANSLAGQFIFDGHTHFLRDDTRLEGFVRMREAVGKAGWNPALVDQPQTLEDLKFNNYFKEVFLDSDTKIAIISSAPSEVPQDWFLTNQMTAQARARVNQLTGSRRMLSHAIFTPGQLGWVEEVERAIAQDQPDSFKGYTIGDNTHKDQSRHPWRMDDEKRLYPFYERLWKANIRNVCVHKGLFPPSVELQYPHLREYSDVRDVGRAAKDWPMLNFIIYHSAYRFPGGGTPEEALAQFEKTGRIEWVSELAEIPEKYGVRNVYGDLGQVFAMTTIAQPRLCAAIMGILVKGLGTDRVVWGSDAVWTGAPQWQIEGLRRLEIPEDMQQKYGFAALGSATGRVKSAIFGETSARLYGIKPAAYADARDRLTTIKAAYRRDGAVPSNLRYGYVARG